MLIVGSDCPFVTVSDVVAGWAALAEQDVGRRVIFGLHGVVVKVARGVYGKLPERVRGLLVV